MEMLSKKSVAVLDMRRRKLTTLDKATAERTFPPGISGLVIVNMVS